MSQTLRIYNTLAREKQEFRPLDASNVRMYVCGPTVYDYAHIGNARPLIVFDVLYRLLRHLYGPEHVTYVRNITDVDDKINARAAERGISIRELTEETNRVFQEDVRALGCLEPTVQPRATEHIPQMIAIIEKLIAAGHAYAADGHVLFDVPSMPDYGRLSRRSLDEMLAGARVDVAPYKRGDMDFVLWKPSKENEPGWDSPWGRGRPGWHIECSAMSWKHLGETFDIHGGGIDLVFPHHENEIAQSRCAFSHEVMANYWMHNGFLQVEGEKMSKSLGNFVTIRELLRGWRGRPWSGRALKYAMLGTHYRQPIDWTVEKLEDARAELAYLVQETRSVAFEDRSLQRSAWTGELQASEEFVAALADDLNTPEAMTIIKHQVRLGSKLTTIERQRLIGNIRLMGLLDLDVLEAHSSTVVASAFSGVPLSVLDRATTITFDLKTHVANNDTEMIASDKASLQELGCETNISKQGLVEIRYHRSHVVFDTPTIGSTHHSISVEDRITARLAARAAKNWAESDRIRDELAAMGIALKDNKDGTTTWEVKR